MKPDIVILANYWRQYPKGEDSLETTLSFLQKINIPHIVVLGPVPYWPQNATKMILDAYIKDHGQISERLPGDSLLDVDVDHRIGNIAKRFGATFISIRDLLCNSTGCLVIADSFPVQSDNSHFTAAGSWYVLRHIEDRIFAGE